MCGLDTAHVTAMILLATERDFARLLEEYLELEIQARKRAVEQARQAETAEADRLQFLAVVVPATVVVGLSLAFAFLFAGLMRTDIVGLFAPGHTGSEAADTGSLLSGLVPTFVGNVVSADDLKAALVALLGLVVAHAALNRTIRAGVAIVLANLLLAANYVVIGSAERHHWPGVLVYSIVAIATVISCSLILQLVSLWPRGGASDAGWLPATIQHWLQSVTGRLLASEDGRPTKFQAIIRRLSSAWVGAGLLTSSPVAITLGDRLHIAWLGGLGFLLAALLLPWLVVWVVCWGIDGVLTKPTSYPAANRAIHWVPVVTTSAIVVASLAFTRVPVAATFTSVVGVACLLAFVGWFVWAEIAVSLAAKVLYLGVFGWALAGLFFFDSDALPLLGAAVLSWCLPRSLPPAPESGQPAKS